MTQKIQKIAIQPHFQINFLKLLYLRIVLEESMNTANLNMYILP